MKKKNTLNSVKFLLLVTVPAILSAIATYYTSVILFILIAFGMLLLLNIPVFKHRENLWMFVIATFATIPINISLVMTISESYFFDYDIVATSVFAGFIIYAILFAVEQIALGLITRIFYRKQYKLFKEPETNNDAL